MPLVERRQREVTTAPIPGVRKTAAKTALSEGAGVEAAKAGASEAMAGFGGRVAREGINAYTQMAEESRRRADSVAILEAERKLGQWENDRLYNPETGALQRRGKDAMGLPEEMRGEFDQVAGEIEKGLGSDRQREAFARVRASRGQGLDLNIQRHVFGEMNRYEAEELKASVENAQASAIANALDPQRVGVELDRAIGAIKTHAPRLGLGPEAVQEQVDKVTSQTHAGVINRLLANDKDKQAKAYFEETKGQITGDDLIRTEKAIDEGSTRAESQRKADEIIASTESFDDQLEQAKTIEDAKLRDAVEQRIEHNQIVTERKEREEKESTLTAAYNVVDKSHDVTSIPPATWANFTGAEKSGLRSYAEHMAKGIPVQTDLKTYYGLIDDAAKQPEKFITANLLQYRGRLDETEFKQLANLQLSMRTGKTKDADKVLEGFSSNEQIWNGILIETGIKKDSKEAVHLREEITRRVDRFQEDTGKKMTDSEKIELGRNLTTQIVLEPGSWANILPGGRPFYDQSKRAIDVTISDVPASEKSAVEAALKAAGVKVTNDSIMTTWIAAKQRMGKPK